MPRDGAFHRLTLDDLCEPHRTREMDALTAYKADHPDGKCTDTCGCMTLEEFKAAVLPDG